MIKRVTARTGMALAALATCPSACQRSTEIVLVVDTDLSVPADIDQIELGRELGQSAWRRKYHQPQPAGFGGRFSVAMRPAAEASNSDGAASQFEKPTDTQN